jgi:hypothetical protein
MIGWAAAACFAALWLMERHSHDTTREELKQHAMDAETWMGVAEQKTEQVQ